MRRGILAFSLMLALAGSIGLAATFDGDPPAPLGYQQVDALAGWDVMVHQRDVQDALEPVVAQHGPDCGPYPGTHVVTTFDGTVFQCRNHIMTSIDSDISGYAAIYLTPPQLLDWSAGEAVISFDISTLVTSSRDWWTITLSSFDSNMAFPLASWLPDGDGLPNDALELRLSPAWRNVCPVVVAGGVESELPGCAWWDSYDNYIPQSATVRTTFEARISANHLKVGIPSIGLVWYDGPLSLPFNQAVVQFGHHSYTPSKDGAGSANTWHWDNITLSPAVPFAINRATPARQYVGSWDVDTTVTFPAAPTGARLRFTSISDVALVNGQPCQSQPSNRADPWGHASSFLCPIPEGSTSATIRGVQLAGWPLGNVIEGIHVWAPGGGSGAPSPTATATPPAPTATNTVAPTATATPVPPTATNTSVPPTATATPAPIGTCQIRWDAPGGTVSYSTLGTRQLTRAQCQALLSMLVP